MKLNTKPMKLISLLALALIITGGATALLNGCKREEAALIPGKAKTLYTCGMHPQVVQDHPGNCPICGMKLQPIRNTTATDSPPPASGKGKVLYYKSTMIPGQTSPAPAKDSMGMDMVPVYENEAAATNSSVIAVDPVTIQDMNMQTTEVARGPLRRVIRTVGTVEYNETALADVTTKFRGWIEELNVDATGQLVHRGEPMFSIYSPELYSAQVEYLLALNPASTNDPGAADLRETAVKKLKYFDISDAQIAELEKTREPRKTLQILAPADGFVTEKNIIEGQMVDAGAVLYRLADLGIVWVYAQIYEQDLPYIQLGQEAVVRVASMPDREFRGRVTYIYPNVDEKTRTARVRLEFENPGYFLKPGMFVSARIASELNPSVLLIPDSAILRSGEKNTVFVALPGGKFDPRIVALGPEAEHDMYQIVSGLSEGERVVTSGQFMLDSESQLREAIQKMREPASAAINVPPSGPTNTMNMTEATPGASMTNGLEQTMPMKTQNQAARATEKLVYVCPMPAHVSITYDHPGTCPICGMALVPVTPSELQRLQPGGKILYYTCPMPQHNYIHEDKPGKCPICGMTLIPVMEATPLPKAPTPAGKEPMPQGMVMPEHQR